MKTSLIFKALLTLMIGIVSSSVVNAQTPQPLINGSQGGQDKGTSPAIQVEVDSKVLNVVKSWDKRIWLFTSKETPVRSFDSLQQKDIAAWGAELMKQVQALYGAIGITDKGVRIIGTGNPIFSGMENPPRLFITWSSNEPELPGAIKIELIEKKPKK